MFYKVLAKSLFCFQKTGSKKHSILVKRKLRTVFNVLIFNTETIDPQNCFLTFLTLKLFIYEYQKLIQIAVLKLQVTVST